jgi:hypothetical protein
MAAKVFGTCDTWRILNFYRDNAGFICLHVCPQVELTYSGIKTGFDYFFPDHHFDPLFPEYADSQCVPLAAFGLEPLSEYEERQVGIHLTRSKVELFSCLQLIRSCLIYLCVILRSQGFGSNVFQSTCAGGSLRLRPINGGR